MTNEKIECPKCGFKNIKGTKVCHKCHSVIRRTKSCPRCAKRNEIDVLKCVNCGYKFNKKERSIFFNLIISLLIIFLLLLLVYFKKANIVKDIRILLQVISVIAILIILYVTLNYGRKEQVNFSAEEEHVNTDPKFLKMKKISKISIIIGLLIAFVVLTCFILLK